MSKLRSCRKRSTFAPLTINPPRSQRPATRSFLNLRRAARCKSLSHCPNPSNGFSLCGLNTSTANAVSSMNNW